MPNVLDKIVENKRKELIIQKEQLPLKQFVDKLDVNNNSFYAALAANGTSYIFECKKASPSKGLIRENFDLNEITTAYSKQAACFSVLTDEKYFQGKYEYLSYVSNKVEQPCLNKDFFIDAYQIHLARHLGASAVLLMLSVLSDEQYSELSALAVQYKMDVLTEVSNKEETERALALGANIIGINNRNLRDLSTDLATTEQLAPLIKQDSRFNGVIISESGIYTHQDILRLSPLVDGFLVGSALMAQPNLDQAIAQLVFGTIKVCGMTSLEQVNMVSKHPVSYLGFIFAPNSKRYISIETALEIKHHTQSNIHPKFVGVFVNSPIEIVAEYSHKLNLACVQLHGDESNDYIVKLKNLLPPHCEIWKVVSVEHNAPSVKKQLDDALGRLNPLMENSTIKRVLLDCKVGDKTGGTGQSFDWQLLDNIANKSAIVLAGGITNHNIESASGLGVGIIDVNSGVEDKPGIKSDQLLSNLFETLRA